MPDTDQWLPSEHRWLDRVTEQVFDGKIVLVRSLPRWGLTTACAHLIRGFANTSVLVKGRDFTEESQKSSRQKIADDVGQVLDQHGLAQVIFDDYGLALRRSQGGALHSMLYRLLVDSESARDTGALLIARFGDPLDLPFSGSPLLSRAEIVTLPTLDEADAETLGMDLAELRRQVGHSTWIARRFMHHSAHQARMSVVEHINIDRRRIVDALPPTAIEVLADARTYSEADPTEQEALRSLGHVDTDSTFKVADLVVKSRLLEEIQVRTPGWPASLPESVDRFARLLTGFDDAIWVDRYALSQVPRFRQFLVELQKKTTARLRVLVSDEKDRSDFAKQISAGLAGLDRVEVRFMSRSDRPLLHDRHLVFPISRSGIVLPTARVILSLDLPGSAVSVALPAFALSYSDCWTRGRQVFPLSQPLNDGYR